MTIRIRKRVQPIGGHTNITKTFGQLGKQVGGKGVGGISTGVRKRARSGRTIGQKGGDA